MLIYVYISYYACYIEDDQMHLAIVVICNCKDRTILIFSNLLSCNEYSFKLISLYTVQLISSPYHYLRY